MALYFFRINILLYNEVILNTTIIKEETIMTKLEIQEYNTKALEEMKHCRKRAFEELYAGNSKGFEYWMTKYDEVQLMKFSEATD